MEIILFLPAAICAVPLIIFSAFLVIGGLS